MFHTCFSHQQKKSITSIFQNFAKIGIPSLNNISKKKFTPLFLITYVGRWKLESLQLCNPYTGVTNNQSEGFNRVMKEFQGWKEAPVDSFILALYQLQSYYFNEIQRGLVGMYMYMYMNAFIAICIEHIANYIS